MDRHLDELHRWRRELGIDDEWARAVHTKDYWYTEGFYCGRVDSNWKPGQYSPIDNELLEAFNLGYADGKGEE